jgi:spermidine synthase
MPPLPSDGLSAPSPPAPSRARAALKVAPLLFCSGACALVYQVAWQREFRLVFGASTAASAAVIAIFIAGLGLGGLWLGRRADRATRPLALYANLELGVAILSAATPVLLHGVRALYLATGGSFVLGMVPATVLRLVLATLVLGGPTFLMGGTLPAAARAVSRDTDARRRDVAVLYGVNTLGAVLGAMFATFVSLEVFGTRMTLILAALVNALVAVSARALARTMPMMEPESATIAGAAGPGGPASVTTRFAFAAALVVGFAFFLMEIVWYRMLGPLLGGTVFTFGLVLALALLGIGLGGALYALFGEKRPATLAAFATTCLVEALAIVVPFALGDSIALFALRLRPLAAFGFGGQLGAWTMVASIVIVPAAIAAGFQFPLLIALVGRGRTHVGEQIGRVYAWNTVGAIAGSVAGGFGLLPLLSATGCWRLVAVLLAALGGAAVVLSIRERVRWTALIVPVACALVAAPMLRATGPTAVWRHGSIGVGRVNLAVAETPNAQHAWTNGMKRNIVWSRDGVESSVALDAQNGLAFIVNGKNDGNARGDSQTQVMCGLLPALLHPSPHKGLVIGLGTGSTAGWLAAVPEIERVDVLELEPMVLEMARRSALVNHDALSNPKLHVLVGDGREGVLTLPDRYDVIASEPSNPYRAGIASLYTAEFYASASRRLTDDGIFAQWLQAYEIDAQTMRTVVAMIASVFPHVEIWELKHSDILLLASNEPLAHDAARLRRRVAEEPFASALRDTWRVVDLEGVLAHHVARASFARAIRDAEGDRLNTDDSTLIEFGFARGLARSYDLALELRLLAKARGEHLPEVAGGFDLGRLEEERDAFLQSSAGVVMLGPDAPAPVLHRQRARQAVLEHDDSRAMNEWRQQPAEPAGLIELGLITEAAAERGDDAAKGLVERLTRVLPLEAKCDEARYLWATKNYDASAASMTEFFVGLRRDPWPEPRVVTRCLAVATLLGQRTPVLAKIILEAASQPFAVSVHETQRRELLQTLSRLPGNEAFCHRAFEPSEPYPEWTMPALEARAVCYARTGDGRLDQATEDIAAYLRNEPMRLGIGLEKR